MRPMLLPPLYLPVWDLFFRARQCTWTCTDEHACIKSLHSDTLLLFTGHHLPFF
jgi:hypothetical protein